MKILICGDRYWASYGWMRHYMLALGMEFGPFELIHGAARGADSIAEKVAEDLRLTIHSFPAKWSEFGKAAGSIRNQQMLDEGKPDLKDPMLHLFSNWYGQQ